MRKILQPMILLVLVISTGVPNGVAQEVAPAGQLRTLNDFFPLILPESTTLADWEHRSSELRRHIQTSLGLFPLPEKTPLNEVIHGKIVMDDYSVERVFFESFPGHFVTGNLYRPLGVTGKTAGVLCPHGHYSNGRFYESSASDVERMLSTGEEKFAENARSPLQARCVQLARMGCTVFHYDMVGYADSVQIASSIAHGFHEQRPHLNGATDYGFFSPAAELNLQSIMGLQTWNSIRSLDFLLSLDEVDPKRIGVTGSSGGGTQTFILGAIDSRPTVAFPAVMVSTGMQGGCTCENCCNLRIDTGNVEFAALFAPKPQGLSAANDWTREMKTKGIPEIRRVYELFGAEKNLEFVETPDFPHGFNLVAREAMYRWFNECLQLNSETTEREIEFLPKESLTVWNDQFPKPATSERAEQEVLQQWRELQSQQIKALVTVQTGLNSGPLEATQRELRSIYRSLVETGRSLERSDGSDGFDSTLKSALVYDKTSQLESNNQQPNQKTYLLFSEGGMDSLRDSFPEIDRLIESLKGNDRTTCRIFVIDTDNLTPESFHENQLVENGREAAGYTYGYNRPALARQVVAIRDLIQAVVEQSVTAGSTTVQNVTVISVDASSLAVAFAAAILETSENQKLDLVLHTNGRRLANVDSLTHRDFLPGGLKYGGVPSLLTLLAPNRLMLFDKGEDLTSLNAIYNSLNDSERLTCINQTQSPNEIIERIVNWLESD